jgi:hypothetical protein
MLEVLIFLKMAQRLKKPDSKRTRQLVVRLDPAVFDKLMGNNDSDGKPMWKKRSKPDPYNLGRDLPFKSNRDYVEFCLRCLNEMPEFGFYLFKHMFNSDIVVK